MNVSNEGPPTLAVDAVETPPRDVGCLDDKLGLWLRMAQKPFVEQVNRRFTKYKVNHLDFMVMTLIDANPGCRLMLLSQNLRLQPPNVAKVVDDLVGRALVSKTADLEDRRANRLSLSEHGIHVLGGLRDEYERLTREVLEGIAPEASVQLLSTLRIIVANIRAKQRQAADVDAWP